MLLAGFILCCFKVIVYYDWVLVDLVFDSILLVVGIWLICCVVFLLC